MINAIFVIIGFVWGFMTMVLKGREYFYKKVVPYLIFLYIIFVFYVVLFGSFNPRSIINIAPIVVGFVIGSIFGRICTKNL